MQEEEQVRFWAEDADLEQKEVDAEPSFSFCGEKRALSSEAEAMRTSTTAAGRPRSARSPRRSEATPSSPIRRLLRRLRRPSRMCAPTFRDSACGAARRRRSARGALRRRRPSRCAWRCRWARTRRWRAARWCTGWRGPRWRSGAASSRCHASCWAGPRVGRTRSRRRSTVGGRDRGDDQAAHPGWADAIEETIKRRTPADAPLPSSYPCPCPCPCPFLSPSPSLSLSLSLFLSLSVSLSPSLSL